MDYTHDWEKLDEYYVDEDCPIPATDQFYFDYWRKTYYDDGVVALYAKIGGPDWKPPSILVLVDRGKHQELLVNCDCPDGDDEDEKAIADETAAMVLAFYTRVKARTPIERIIGCAKCQVQLTVRGKPFKCECGANVFTKTLSSIYRCNACGAEYEGDM